MKRIRNLFKSNPTKTMDERLRTRITHEGNIYANPTTTTAHSSDDEERQIFDIIHNLPDSDHLLTPTTETQGTTREVEENNYEIPSSSQHQGNEEPIFDTLSNIRRSTNSSTTRTEIQEKEIRTVEEPIYANVEQPEQLYAQVNFEAKTKKGMLKEQKTTSVSVRTLVEMFEREKNSLLKPASPEKTTARLENDDAQSQELDSPFTQ